MVRRFTLDKRLTLKEWKACIEMQATLNDK
jgi:hypothetical protein